MIFTIIMAVIALINADIALVLGILAFIKRYWDDNEED